MATHAGPQIQKTALITGGTSGLGLACAEALLREGTHRWNLLLTGRDTAKGRAAVNKLRGAAEFSAEFLELDLGSFSSIRHLVAVLQQRQLLLDALVCNAGVQFMNEGPRTAEGYEPTFGINHLGHFYLLHSIAPLFNQNARIVVVSSSTHDPAQKTGTPPPRWIDPSYLANPETDASRQFEADDAPARINQRRYTTSKLCNLYFAYELDRRLHRPNPSLPMPTSITVNAFDPGLMPGTALGREFKGPQRFVWRYVLPALRPLLRKAIGNVHSPAESGAALAALIDSDDFNGISGKYFEGRNEISSSGESHDLQRAELLWRTSERLTELSHRDVA